MKERHSLVNASLSTSRFPATHKHALVTPVLEKTSMDPAQITDYRPFFCFKTTGDDGGQSDVSVPQRQQVISAAAVSLTTTTLNRDGAAEDSEGHAARH